MPPQNQCNHTEKNRPSASIKFDEVPPKNLSLANALGWISLLFALAATQLTGKRPIPWCDITCCVCKVLHFYLLDAPGGVFAEVIFLIVCLLGLLGEAAPEYKQFFWLIYPAAIGLASE
jgi:hypothetical protein